MADTPASELSPTAKVRSFANHDGSETAGYFFFCPGCKSPHALSVQTSIDPDRGWQFNGDVERPTFTPSVLANGDRGNPGHPVCHSYLTDGRIRFLEDSTHDLAGQTVDLPAWITPENVYQ